MPTHANTHTYMPTCTQISVVTLLEQKSLVGLNDNELIFNLNCVFRYYCDNYECIHTHTMTHMLTLGKTITVGYTYSDWQISNITV